MEIKIVYLITYDLNKPTQKYEKLYEIIKNIEPEAGCCHLMRSAWLVYTSKLNATQIQNKLKPALDTNDSIWIVKVTKEQDGWLTEKAIEWIKRHIIYNPS